MMHVTTTPRVQTLSYATLEDPVPKRMAIQGIEWLTGKDRLAREVDYLLNKRQDAHVPWDRALASLQVQPDYDEAQIERTPPTGPLVFVSNHPFGVVDGLILCSLAARTRKDFRILVHRQMCVHPRLDQHFLPVEFRNIEAAAHINIETKSRAKAYLNAGGTLIIFPAGGISTSPGISGRAMDLEWKLLAAKLVQRTKATVVPVYFYGQNSRLFQFVSQFSLTLRLSLIIYETNRLRGKDIRLAIGDPVPYESLASIRRAVDLTQALRDMVYGLPAQQE